MAKVSGFHPEDAVRPRHFAQIITLQYLWLTMSFPPTDSSASGKAS
jgi:hypothetical protein